MRHSIKRCRASCRPRVRLNLANRLCIGDIHYTSAAVALYEQIRTLTSLSFIAVLRCCRFLTKRSGILSLMTAFSMASSGEAGALRAHGYEPLDIELERMDHSRFVPIAEVAFGRVPALNCPGRQVMRQAAIRAYRVTLPKPKITVQLTSQGPLWTSILMKVSTFHSSRSPNVLGHQVACQAAHLKPGARTWKPLLSIVNATPP